MFTLIDFNDSHSAISHYLGKLRDKNVQRDQYLFCNNLKLLGTLLAYEASKSYNFSHEVQIKTPLGSLRQYEFHKYPVIINILRAANPFVSGVRKVFRYSKVSYFGVSRNEETLESKIYYEKIQDHNNRVLIIPDPMLATGASMEVVIKRLLKFGIPTKIIIVSCIAHQDGIDCIKSQFEDVTFIIGAIDPTLNDKGYIIPGLGDCGDLCYGK